MIEYNTGGPMCFVNCEDLYALLLHCNWHVTYVPTCSYHLTVLSIAYRYGTYIIIVAYAVVPVVWEL